MVLAYIAVALCALCYGLGSVLQSIAAKRVRAGDRLDVKGMADVAKQIPYVCGVALDAFGFVLSLVAVTRLPLFVVQAVVAGSVGFVVLFAALIERVIPNRRQVGFLVVLAIGLLGLAVSGAPEKAKHAADGFTIAMAVVAALVIAAGILAPRKLSPSQTAATLGALAGIAFGGTALCARSISANVGVHTLVDPQAFLLVVFGLSGLAFYTGALQRGSVTVATAWVYTTETFAPALVGILVFGDRARHGLGLVAVLSFFVTVFAAVGLTLVSPPEHASVAV